MHGVEQFVVHVAQVDAELDLAGDHVAAVREYLHHAHRAAPVRRVAVGDRHHLLHDGGGHLQRILAQAHGRRSRMRFHARHHAVVPRQAHHGRHHADDFIGVFQHGPLLDMRLKVGADRMVARHLLALVSDARQLLAHRFSLRVFRRVRGLQRKGAAKHARTHHHGHEARTFLVGPERHLDGRLRLDLQIVQGAHHFQARQHAVIAIELAARGLGIDMAARHHGRKCVVDAIAAHEDIADLVDGDAHARVPAPAHHQVAAFFVQVRQGQALDAALGRGTDPRQFHQGRPQAVAIDPQFTHATLLVMP